jgi:hypothetical protein
MRKVNVETNFNKFCLCIHLQLRYSSQLSLTSAADLMEFRYCNVYTKIGLYKGRVVAIKKIQKKNIEITRKMKKELKIVSSFIFFHIIYDIMMF